MQEYIKSIENTDIFIEHKVELLLLLLGEKGAADIYLFSKEQPHHEEVAVEQKRINNAVATLESLPVTYEVQPPVIDTVDRENGDVAYLQYVNILVTSTGEEMEQLKQARDDNDHRTQGRIYGYPETAIAAFGSGTIKQVASLPSSVVRSPRFCFARFALSESHWEEELQTGEKWATLVKQNSPKIYEEFVELTQDLYVDD